VSSLILVISDLYPVRRQWQQQLSLPRLAQLEQWLARGEHSRIEAGWQQWLLEVFGAARHAGHSWAQVAAAAVPAASAADTGRHPAGAWLATPVHLVAGLDTVRVHPAGLLTLTREEQFELARDFATVFQGAGWTLHATLQRELLLQSDRSLQARSSDPARWLGSDPAQGMVAGADAGALRRLGAELEMWLHEHPVNRARLARALLPVSALWLWGGTAPAPALAPARSPAAAGARATALTVYGADLFLAGLCAAAGARSQQLVLPWPAAHQAAGAPGDVIVHGQLGPAPDTASLQALEQQLIAPLVAQLRRGDWESLTLLVGDRAVLLRRHGWRVWQSLIRSRPWWERLLG
jgi:hypothetical protein